MARLLFIVLTWLTYCAGFTSSADANMADSYPRKLSFVDVLKNRDIALGEVLSVAQDEHGFMWFGGRNALVRYDGYDFVEVFSAKEAAKTGSEPLAWVFGLHVDSDNQLWAGTRDGLFRLDRDYNVFRRIASENPLLTQVNVIKQAASGEILVGTYGGFSVLDKMGKPLKQWSGPLEDAEARGFKALLPNANIHAVTFDSEYIWLGTGVGLTRVNLSDDSVKNYVPFPENPQSTSENEIWSLDVAPSGHIWAGSHNGAYRFNPDDETFKRYQHDPKDRTSLGGNYIWDVLVDKQGWVWFCTDSGGVSLYDQHNDRFIRYDNVKSRPDSLKYSSTRKVFEDNIGDLWVTTFPTGINYYDRSTAAFDNVTAVAGEKNSLSDSNVWTLSEDSKGRIWLGTSGGVDRYTPTSGEFANFTADNGGIALNNLISSHVDSKDRVWVGTWEGGLHRFSAKNNRFEVVPFAPELIGSGQKVHDKLIGKTIWNIREDDEGFLWLATHNVGLVRYSPEQSEFVHYPSNPSDPETLTNSIVWTTFEDSRGNFWIGTVGGLNLFDKKAGKVIQRIYKDEGVEGALNNDSILSIYEDSQGRLWFGTNAGLHLYDYETQRFSFYGTQDGFSDMSIRSILESPDGELWLGTNNGVVRFEPQTNKVTNYKTYNGQQLGSFNTGAGLRTSKDELMFGGVNGWRIYHVDKLKSNDYRPPVQITNFSLYTKPVSVGDETGLLDKVVSQADEIVFDYTQNMFSFNFAALSFRNSNRNTYAYKLEGFDDDWREIGTQRKAQYTNLSPGDYIFKVKAANNDGVWNEQGASLKITQLPPPWKTWWAYTLYALILLAAVAYLIHRQRMKRKRVEEQNRILEVKVAERTSEIAAKNKNIQSMLSNMRQGLFTVEPDGKVHSEYSAHLEEIFATREIAGRDAIDLLFSEADLGSDALNQAQEGLKAIIGEDEMNFTFNSHVLPSEYSLTKGEKTQYLQLSWDPIIEDGVVEKLMVSVRDITQLKETEAEAQEQRRELDIITQIIAVDDKKYQELIKTTEVFIVENRQAIERTQGLDEAVVALLFRNMHTIKGNCRTYGFVYLTDVVHEVENYYSQLKAGTASWDSTRLLGDLERVELAFAEYQKVHHEVLGRDGAATTEAKKGGRVAPEILEAVRNYLYRATVESPEVATNTNVTSAKALIEIAQSETLTNILSDIVQSIPAMAKQLDKPAPTIHIIDYNIRIKDAAHNLLTHVFAHLMRNSVDHGIEPAKARLEAQKPASGAISITALEQGERLAITLRDDGRGLNMQRLYQQGVALGQWQAGDKVSPEAVANLMFASGASTKEEVTSISGRGVGMDAVKQFLNNAGGDISLTLEPSASSQDAFVHFETIITLPKSLYYAISLI